MPDAPSILPPPPSVSARITAPLRQVAARRRLFRLLVAALEVFALTLAVWLTVALLLGHFPALPMPFRAALLALAWGTFLISAVRRLAPAARRTSLPRAAAEIERALPDVQERLSSAVELSAEPNPAYRGSPELLARLMREAQHAAGNIDPADVIPATRLTWTFTLCLPLLLAWGLLALFDNSAVLSGLQQTLQPWKAAPSPAAAQFVITPNADLQVPQGDSVQITLEVLDPDHTNRPVDRAAILCRYPSQSVSAEMERTGPRAFRYSLDNLQQTLAFRVSTPEAQSAARTITVLPRPAISKIEVEYIYPKYTGLQPRTETARDGTVEAVVGTAATLHIFTTQRLANESILRFAGPLAAEPALRLQPVADRHYTAAFTLARDGQYRLELQSTIQQTGQQTGLANRDNHPHNIFARPDLPPSIAIISPVPTLRVRPDDIVPVQYEARDDFAVASVEALVAVDGQALQTTRVPPPADAAPAHITGTWRIDIPAELQRRNLNPRTARRLTYQLKATDNRDPNPQSALTATYTLELDSAVGSLAARTEAAQAKDLAEAISQTEEKLAAAERKLAEVQKADPAQPLSPEQQRAAEQAKRDLTDAAQKLSDSARREQNTAFQDSARQAQRTAQDAIKPAADSVGQSQLSDQPQARQESLSDAQKHLADAQKQLEDINQQLQNQTADRRVTQQLDDLRRQQEALAREAQAPDAAQHQQELAQKQQKLKDQTEQLQRQNPEFQKPAARAAEPQVDDLRKNIDEIQQAQKPLNDQARKAADASDLQDRGRKLADEQTQLNRDINEFSAKQADPLRHAAAAPPDPKKLEPIPRDLQANRLQSAEQAQKAAASALEESARKMDRAAQHAQDNAAKAAAQAAAAQKEADAAQSLAQEAKDLAQEINRAKASRQDPVRPSDPANQHAQDLAQRLQKQAQDAAAQGPTLKAAAEEAKRAAAEAQQMAHDEGRAEDAQQKLQQAAEGFAAKERQAAQQAQAAAENAAHPPAQEAGKQASQLAQRQRALADQTQALDQARQDAQNAETPAPEQTAQQQRDVAQKIQQAADDARKLQQSSQSHAPELARRAQDAAEHLQDAAQHQTQAAGSSHPQKANQNQQQSARDLAQAGEALQGAKDFAHQPPQNPSGQPASPATADALQRAAQAIQQARDAQDQALHGQPAPNPAAAQQAADRLAQASRNLQQATAPGAQASSPGAPDGNPGHDPRTPNSPGPIAQGPKTNGPNGPIGPPEGGTTDHGPRTTDYSPSSPQGVQIPHAPTVDARPPAIKDLGINPSDWARLTPDLQQQFLTAAQQQGPPSYQEMIKNYYIRIARLEAQPQEP